MAGDGKPLYFSIITLGCKVNQYESDRIRERLLHYGFCEAPPGQEADACIVNTCAVTREAARKSRQMLRRAGRLAPGGRLFAAGCAAEMPGEFLSGLDENVVMLGNRDKDNLADFIAASFQVPPSPLPPPVSRGRIRAYLKVQDGCDHFCSYCIIPRLRGRSRSRNPGEVLAEMQKLQEAGFQEVVITGIHLGDYGKGTNPKTDLPGLLEMLLLNTSIPRIRLSSLEPMDFSFGLLPLFEKHKRLCRHLHLPLQHASDAILQKMGRDYALKDYDRIITSAIDSLPGMNVTTDIMAGFPGEGEDDFRILCDYVKKAPLFRLHVFPFSLHSGVKAAGLEGFVPGGIKDERVRILSALGREKTRQVMERCIGDTVEVLVEQQNRRGMLSGHTGNYLCVEFPGDRTLKGKIVRIKIKGISGEALYGEDPEPAGNGR